MGNRRIRITIFVSFCFLWSLWEIISLSGCSDIPLSSILESGKVKLSWNDVPGAMSYNVYMSTSPGITKYNSNKIRNATSPITITDLEPGTIYYFVVTVIDESGESEESKEISYTAVMDTVGSIDFEDLLNKLMLENTASKSEKGQVTLAWDNVPNAISYNIYWNNSPGVTKQNGKKISNVKNPHTINGLKRGATYYFVVTAVGESGESEESEEISFTVGQ